MKEDTQLTMNDFITLGSEVYEIVNNYPITVEDLISVMQVYAEWQENVYGASLEDTLWMEDGTPMVPSLTRYLYHQMYGLSDLYDSDEEDEDNE